MVLLGLLVQTQIRIGQTPQSLGLTLNLADFTLPALGLFILLSLVRRTSSWPVWRARHTDIFMAALTAYFLFSVAYAYGTSGVLSPWALINRLVGWAVVLSYFYAGAWITTRYGAKLARPFFTSLALFALLTASAETIGIILTDLKLLPPGLIRYPLDGLMGNRNALAFVFTAALVAIGVYSAGAPSRTTRILLTLFCLLGATFTSFNGSRVILVMLPIVFLFLACLHGRRAGQAVFLPFLIGVLILSCVIIPLTGKGLREDQTERIDIAVLIDKNAKKIHSSDDVRTLVNNDAIEAFTAHPVFGIGLGNFLEHQKQKYGRLIDLIDSVPLWFLTEMGIVGFSLFLAFGARIFWSVIRGARASETPPCAETLLCRAAVGVILVFCVMGLVHQLFYARFFWLILGLAAARPCAPQLFSSR